MSGFSAHGPWTVRKADGSVATIVDADGNIDAPITTTNATFSGNTTLGDAAGDTVTVNGTSTVNAPLTVGSDGTGHDVRLYSATAGNSFLWDESADKLILTHTSASTDAGTSVEPLTFSSTMTGIGGVGGRAKFSLSANVALGGWSNALKAETTYGASGRTTGLGSAFVAELTLSAGTTSGTYAPLEVELNLGSNAPIGTNTSFAYFSANGTATNFIDSGYLFSLQGLGAAASGKIFQANTAADATHALKILIGSTPYYIMLTSVGA